MKQRSYKKSYKNELPQVIWEHALKSRGHGRMNFSALARLINVRNSKLWYYLRAKSRWPADAWLRCMVAAGFARMADGVVLIVLEVPEKIYRELEVIALAGEETIYRRRRIKNAPKKDGSEPVEIAEDSRLT